MLHLMRVGLRTLMCAEQLVNQNCAVLPRTIYSFTGIEWTFEKDRVFEEKLRPYTEQMRERRSVDIEKQQLPENDMQKLLAIKMEYKLLMGDLSEYILDHEWLTLLYMKYNKRMALSKSLVKKAASRKKQAAKLINKGNPEEDDKAQKNDVHQPEKKNEISKFMPMVSNDIRLPLCKKKSIMAKQYGVPLVLDFSYDSLMKDTHINSLVRQFNTIYGDNRLDADPFNLVLSNLKAGDRFAQNLSFHQPISDLYQDYTEDCYTTLFPREQLVYLSPHSKKILTRFDPTKVYIIGALVDKGFLHDQHSMKQALDRGVQTAALPFSLVRNKFRFQRHAINADIVVKILLRMKYHNNFERAIEECMPRRLLEYVQPG